MDDKDVVKYEFIGEKLKVINSENKDLVGVSGKVIDESRNMFVLDNGKRLIKDQCEFEVEFEDKVFHVKGKLLVGRPEDRLKKRIK
tara:strand:- start:429 stop:686 length:258 start_codon:yes stop_codon:yes gene_type:complete